MTKFKHIENEDICPKEEQHVEYAEVYRAVKNDKALSNYDFLPWNVEHPNKMKTFKNLCNKQSSYGLSVYTDLLELKRTVSRFPALREETKAYARGYTTIKRGISLKEDKHHHVEYFLYDYELNSPKDDFCIAEEVELDER